VRVNLDPLDGAVVPDALSVIEKMQQNQKCTILQPIGLFATDGHKVQNLHVGGQAMPWDIKMQRKVMLY